MVDPLSDIMDERCRQDAKWGQQNHGDLYWLGILMEEVGEMARQIIATETPTTRMRTREELVQIAAVSLAWLECLNRRDQAKE